MKKIRNLLLVLMITLMVGISSVYASGFSVSSNSSTVIVGNTFKVSVTVSSSDLGAWSYCISYDSSLLKLTGSTADASTCVKAGVTGLTGKTETFTFKALKSGSATVSVKNAAIYSYSTEQQISGISTGSAKIKLMTQSELEATYSTNANLSNIAVTSYVAETDTTTTYDLTPEFSKDVYEYEVTVPNEIEAVTVSTNKEDKTASVSGSGDIQLIEGSNKVEIVVTAQKGNQLTYTLNITREELDPIEVKLDGNTYTIVRKASALENLVGYEATTVSYEEFEIPALYSETLDYTIVGVKDDDGNITMYRYEDGKLTSKYIELKYGDTIITPISLKENDIFTYSIAKVSTKLDFDAYKVNKNLKIISSLDTSTGEENYYLYNTKDGSFMLYNGEIDKVYDKKIQNYKYVIYGLIALCVILLLIALFKKGDKEVKKAKKEEKKRLKEEKKQAKKLLKEQEIQEENEEEEISEEENEIVEEEEEEVKEEPKFEKTAKVPVQSERKEELELDDDDDDEEEKETTAKKTREQIKNEKLEAKRRKKEEKEQKKKNKNFDW